MRELPPWTKKRFDRQADRADRAVERAVAEIEAAVNRLLDRTLPLDCIACDYVIEHLVEVLIDRNPQGIDFLNRQRGSVTVALANALMDWRDMWERRA